MRFQATAFILLASLAGTIWVGPAWSASGCPRSFAHLESKIPTSNHPELQRIRREILNTSSEKVARDAIANGCDLFSAAVLAMRQAESLEATSEGALASMRGFTSGATGEERLRAGDWSFYTGPDPGAGEAAAQAYASQIMAKIASEETAVILACMAASGHPGATGGRPGSCSDPGPMGGGASADASYDEPDAAPTPNTGMQLFNTLLSVAAVAVAAGM